MPQAANHTPLVDERDIVHARPRIIPRTKPTPIPTDGIFDEPTICVRINRQWAAHLLGVVSVGLDQPDTWIGTEEEVEAARIQIREWIIRLFTGDDCMPCCDDLVDQLTELITVNNSMLTQITTIVTNLTTVINQGDTTIDNSNLAIYNQYLSEYNQYVSNNSNQQTWNNMFYDGTPQSIAPGAGDNFSETGADSEKILCAAIEKFIANMIYVYGIQNLLRGGIAGAAATAFVAIGSALAVFSAGTSIVAGVAIAGLILADNVLWNAIMNDPEAHRKARCCMYGNLKGQAITEENFKHAFDDCGFAPGSHEAVLTDQLSNSVFYFHDDYLGFLKFYQESNASGGTSDCDCSCDGDIVLEDFAGTGCTITPLGNCLYRFVQNTPNVEHFGWHYSSFRDIMSRCLKVESPPVGYENMGIGGCTTVGCCGNADYNGDDHGGGFSGALVSSSFWTGDPMNTVYKITLQDMDECP